MREFWEKRWSEGKTGFHEGAANAMLVEHVARIETKKPARILVPLAGKSADMRWLAERGHEVVGVEIVPQALRAFFEEWHVEPASTKLGRHTALAAKGVTMVCADVFDVTPDDLGTFDVVYDRAALVALEPPMRKPYVEACRALLRDGGATFLVAFAYDQSVTHGPPWSVDEKTVRELHGARAIEILGSRVVSIPPRLAEAGVTEVVETAYLVT